MPHAPVSKIQRGRAKRLRRAMTRAETLLWRYLKAHHVEGLAFRRQVPMGAYIADFVCHARKLVVELDGESHDFEAAVVRDVARDRWFTGRGYRVLRFTNEDVLTNLDGVVQAITAAAVPPSLSLPRKGGGNDRRTADTQRQQGGER